MDGPMTPVPTWPMLAQAWGEMWHTMMPLSMYGAVIVGTVLIVMLVVGVLGVVLADGGTGDVI